MLVTLHLEIEDNRNILQTAYVSACGLMCHLFVRKYFDAYTWWPKQNLHWNSKPVAQSKPEKKHTNSSYFKGVMTLFQALNLSCDDGTDVDQAFIIDTLRRKTLNCCKCNKYTSQLAMNLMTLTAKLLS